MVSETLSENYADYGRSEDTDYSAISPVSEYNDYDNEDNYRQTPRLFTDDPCLVSLLT